MLAVSGGSDSLALLHLASVWALRNEVTLQAVTVDHGLRPEAASEAAFVSGVCASLGVDHVTLAWEGIKPSFGIQEAARQSRYSLMDDFAHEIGAEVIVTGHTRDDQIETVMMRMLRNKPQSDGRGLAGMAAKTWLYGGNALMRPLLDLTRQELRAYLADLGQPWIEDPSNHDDSYERVRIRNSLVGRSETCNNILKLADLSARMRRHLAGEVAGYLDRAVIVNPGPVFEIAASKVCRDAVSSHALQVLVAIAGGQLHLVPRHRLEAVYDMLNRQLSPGGISRMTLGGACLELRKGKLAIYREARNQSALMLDAGETAIWDGRMHVYNGTALPVFIEIADRRQIREFEDLRGKPYQVKPRAALRSTPVLHVQNRGGESQPLLPLVESARLPRGLEVRMAAPAIEHFCPQFDEPLRAWLQTLDNFQAASLEP